MALKSPDRYISSYDPDASARDAFDSGLEYENKIFPSLTVTNNIDFSGDDRYYGVIDTEGHALLLKEEVLKQIKYCEDNRTLWAVNFVADAWADLAAKIRVYGNNGKMITAGPFFNPVAFESWKNPDVEYDKHIKHRVYPKLLEKLDVPKESKKVDSLQSFLLSFSEFGKDHSNRMPITRTGYVESRYFDRACTGLVLNLDDGSKSDVAAKVENYINDPNFTFFCDVAKQYGFLIDKHNPSRIVANLRSPAMQRYMAKYQYYNTEQYFQQACDKSHSFDMVALEVYALDMYDTYVAASPYITTYKIHPSLKCGTQAVSIGRKYSPPNSFGKEDSLFAKKWSLSTYFFLRINERSLKISPREHKITLRTLYTLKEVEGSGYNQAFDFLINRVIGPVI